MKNINRRYVYLAVLIAVAVASVIEECQSSGNKSTSKSDVAVSPTPSAEIMSITEEIPDTLAKSPRLRAKGLEIPAYLTDREEEIVIHEGFTLSYNRKRLVPNWVAWVLTPERTQGDVKRLDDFQPDLSIEKGPIAELSDYRRSGYDRGHMCPAADNKHSKSAMRQSFLLSNMCPQTHTLNAGDWEELEDLCRKWAVAYDSIYIVCGPIIEKGVKYETIGDNRNNFIRW